MNDNSEISIKDLKKDINSNLVKIMNLSNEELNIIQNSIKIKRYKIDNSDLCLNSFSIFLLHTSLKDSQDDVFSVYFDLQEPENSESSDRPIVVNGIKISSNFEQEYVKEKIKVLLNYLMEEIQFKGRESIENFIKNTRKKIEDEINKIKKTTSKNKKYLKTKVEEDDEMIFLLDRDSEISTNFNPNDKNKKKLIRLINYILLLKSKDVFDY